MHKDAEHRLPETSYFLLGNGHIHATVQVSAFEGASPTALFFTAPGRAAEAKRHWLGFDMERGFGASQLFVQIGDEELHADGRTCTRRWVNNEGIPTVEIGWTSPLINVRERFFCPDRREALVLREIRLTNPNKKRVTLEVYSGEGENRVTERMRLDAYARKRLTVEYRLLPQDEATSSKAGARIQASMITWSSPLIADVRTWDALLQCFCYDDRFARAISAARTQIGAQFSATGLGDSRLWNAHAARPANDAELFGGLLLSGYHDTARMVLQQVFAGDGPRLLEKTENFVNAASWPAVLKDYLLWTGDFATVHELWPQCLPIVEMLALRAQERLAASESEDSSSADFKYWAADSTSRKYCSALLTAQSLDAAAEVAQQLRLHAAGSLDSGLPQEDQMRDWKSLAKKLAEAGQKLLGERLPQTQPDAGQTAVADPEEAQNPKDPRASGARVLPMACMSAKLLARSSEVDAGPAELQMFDDCSILWNQQWQNGGYGRFDAALEAETGKPEAGARPLCSLWVAQAAVELDLADGASRVLEWLLDLESATGTWFERLPPQNGSAVASGTATENSGADTGATSDTSSLDPTAWAALLRLFIFHLFGIRPSWNGVIIRPRLIRGCEQVRVSIPIRGTVLVLIIHAASAQNKFEARLNEERLDVSGPEIHLPLDQPEQVLELILPAPQSRREEPESRRFVI